MAPQPLNDQEIRDFLALHRVPQFIDVFIMSLIERQPDDWRPMLLEMIERVERSGGKGAKAVSAAKEAKEAAGVVGNKALKFSADDPFAGASDHDVPPYCKRDPKMKPDRRQIVAKGVVENENTRASIKAPQQMTGSATSISAEFNYAANKCQGQCKLIVQECKQQNRPFFDSQFWFGDRNTMYPKGVPPDCTVTEPRKAMRACELYAGAPLFTGGASSNDIVQGAVGDCFFIGAVSALASCSAQNLKPVERLFVFSDIKWGVYGVMFFKNGGWRWVIVDDWVAVCQDDRGNTWPQYASPGTEPELWPMIIEKAYAKICYCWDSIDGGWARQALEDLTGGLAYTLDLAKKDKKEYGVFPSNFQALNDNPLNILGCSVGWHVSDGAGGGAGRAGEQGTLGGLFKGHAYSIIKMVTCSDGQAFVRVRNPWGNDAEWTGAYGDRSPEWNRNPLYKRELKPEFKDDGAFWMKWEDFAQIFTDIDVARFFRYDDIVITMFGVARVEDFQPNNTYILKVDKVCTACIALGQDDPLTKLDHSTRKNGKYKGMMMSCFKLTKLPAEFEDLQGCFGEKTNLPSGATRTVFKEMKLEPGHYALIPRFRDASGVGYYIRIIAAAHTDLALWKWSDGPDSAMNSHQAHANAINVPAVAVSALQPSESGHDSLGSQTSATASHTGGLSETIIKGLGIENKAKFDEMVRRAFNAGDKRNRGELSKADAKEAFKRFMAEQPIVQRSFETAFERFGQSKVNPSEFKAILDQTFMGMVAA